MQFPLPKFDWTGIQSVLRMIDSSFCINYTHLSFINGNSLKPRLS